MKQLRLLLLFSFLSNIGIAQQSSPLADSLLKVLPGTEDTLRVQVLNDLCYEFAFIDPQKGKEYGYTALELANQIHYDLGSAKALIRLGIIYDVTAQFDSSISCYLQSGVYYARINNLKGKGSAINNIGMLYATKGQFSKALGNYFAALKIFESINEENFRGNCLNNIGIVYSDLYQYKHAQTYFKQAITIYQRTGNKAALASTYTNLGRNYSDLDLHDSALYYFEKSMVLEKELNNIYGLGILYNNLAITYKDKKDPEKGLFYLHESLKIKKQLDDKTGEASTLLNISDAYAQEGNTKQAEKYLLESHNLALTLNSYRILRKSGYQLYKLYKTQGNYAKAIQYVDVYSMARDSAINEESAREIASLEARYESEKKALALEKKDLELKNANFEITHKQNTIIILIATCTLILLSSVLLYNQYRHKQQQAMAQQLLQQQELRNKAIIEAEEKERIRIARELHDGIGQQLSAAKMNLSAFEASIGTEHKEKYRSLMDLVDDAVKEVRTISHNMMPNALLRSGLSSAVREFVNKLSITDALKIDLQIVGLNTRLESAAESVLYRVIQECVSNIIKHADASHINIQLIKHDTHLNLLIEDNGKGFETSNLEKFEGIGLKNIISRVQYLDGTIDFDSMPGRGTTIVVDVPC
ncbi:MAG: sensor histidine kinase [Bacteroidota bacterium]